ncbi:hypothetical protein AAG906_018148 [Vitis piasezkii]
MKMKNRNRFVDNDEFEVADILLQIPHIIFESESRLPLTWGFRRKISAIDPSLFVEDGGRFNSSERVSKIGEFQIENVKLLCSTLKTLNLELKLNLDTTIAEARVESVEQDLNLNIALNFDTTQMKRVAAA